MVKQIEFKHAAEVINFIDNMRSYTLIRYFIDLCTVWSGVNFTWSLDQRYHLLIHHYISKTNGCHIKDKELRCRFYNVVINTCIFTIFDMLVKNSFQIVVFLVQPRVSNSISIWSITVLILTKAHVMPKYSTHFTLLLIFGIHLKLMIRALYLAWHAFVNSWH